ncbi:MAG: DEAD/DEAH box helicase [Spirochaetaceae bacterium]|nr:DEAD/DEAH box helicase [Spirochaetaceae bacterium]
MEEIITFEDLGLDEISLEAVSKKGFENPSPIQILAIPRLLEGDANVIAKARTGTGKTAAFGLPLSQKIRTDTGKIRALVLAPTRELALQVCKEIDSLHSGQYPRCTAVYGGQGYGDQLRALKRGVEIVVGTPGRVQDHLERGTLDISKIDFFILDEADEMLDMGFIEDIEAIFAQANPNCRILLFSATMPQPILKIATQFMGDYEIVEEESTPETPVLTEQKYIYVREKDKLEAIVRIIDISPDFYGLLFTQTKADADTLTRQLDERGYEVAALHGDISQLQREKILYRFRIKKTRILVATDVAARGIDIEGLSHVINYSLPFDSSTYIHRIGRTGRAGAKGVAITFVRPEERRKLEHLKFAIKKGVKGSLEEMQIPSVKKVLEAKRKRLFDSMKISLENEEATTFDNQNDEDIFAKMASELCMEKTPQEVLVSVLKSFYGKQLDSSRYNNITPVAPKNARFADRKSGNFLQESTVLKDAKQIRLYVQLGRRDGFRVREIADFFSKLLDIPQRLVDKIDVADSFSLVSLPKDAAFIALEMSKKRKDVPHMHLDVKTTNSGDDFKRDSNHYRNRFERPKRFNNSKKNSSNKKNNTRTSNASLYKRKQP